MPSTIRGSDNFDSGRYESTEQVITSGATLTLPHGLGVRPFMLQLELICKTAEDGWSVGDILIPAQISTSSSNRVNTLYSDATNIYLIYEDATNCFATTDKSTGAGALLTNANWRVIIKGIA